MTLAIVIADDAPLFRNLAATVLRRHGEVREVGGTGELYAALARQPADVVVLDIRMPPTQTVEGIDAAVRIREKYPTTGILLLSHLLETQHLDRLLAGTGAGFGYLLKERVSGIEQFSQAVRTVAGGGHVIDPEVVTALLEQRRSRELTGVLSAREREVLSLMAQGSSNAAISSRLFISAKTVEATIHRILARLEVPVHSDHNPRVLAVLRYLRGSAA